MKKIKENIYEVETKDIKPIFKLRKSDTNKGDYGYIGILGGCTEYSGAIKLANLSASAVRAGAGVVRVIIPQRIINSISPYLLEQTIFPIESTDDGKMIYNENLISKSLNKLKALSIGMGWGSGNDNQKILKYVLENYNIPLVIDADGLNTLSQMNLEILNKTNCKVILTPHLKEFERISKIPLEKIKQDKIELAKEFAKKYNVILLLKGNVTIVTDGNDVYLVKRGCPGMATAGSGDVLSGILAGILGYNEPNILTISAGAYLAGVAGELAQEKYTDISMKASDTIQFIPEAIKYIRKS